MTRFIMSWYFRKRNKLNAVILGKQFTLGRFTMLVYPQSRKAGDEGRMECYVEM